MVDTPPKMQKRFGAGKMLVPTPALVDALMQQAPSGQLFTVDQIRERLAKDFSVDSTCPLTTGIFVRISAESAEEYLSMGRKDITPYWRVVKSDGSLNEKFPGGVEALHSVLQILGLMGRITIKSGVNAPQARGIREFNGFSAPNRHECLIGIVAVLLVYPNQLRYLLFQILTVSILLPISLEGSQQVLQIVLYIFHR